MEYSVDIWSIYRKEKCFTFFMWWVGTLFCTGVLDEVRVKNKQTKKQKEEEVGCSTAHVFVMGVSVGLFIVKGLNALL